MTVVVDIINNALQTFGTRTTITAAELLANSTNEAIQANQIYANTRDSLARMAQWDCSTKTANLVYITSVPGTPENQSTTSALWAPGIPRPPWAYEYQYPADCLRACWMIPSTQFGFSGGVPITTAVTGGASTLWNGAPIRFKVGIDQFYCAIVAGLAVAGGGVGYAVGDFITLALPSNSPPAGAPAVLQVATIAGSAVSTVNVVSQINGEAVPQGGSYFAPNLLNSFNCPQGSTTGSGTGAVFNFNYGSQLSQRVIYTNQEFATMVYVAQTIDPNLWDPLFQDALQELLGAKLCMALTGDKQQANQCIAKANAAIKEARAVDGNEGLTINDVTPDWIRTRGIWWSDNLQSGPYAGFDWGGWLPSY